MAECNRSPILNSSFLDASCHRNNSVASVPLSHSTHFPEFEALAKVERKNGSGRNEVGQLPSQFGERV